MLLISLPASDGSARGGCQYVLLRGRKVIGSGALAVEELPAVPAGAVRVALECGLAFSERVEVAAFNRAVVPFSVRRHLKGLSVFPGAFREAVSADSLSGGRASAWVTAAPESDVESGLRQVDSTTRPVEVVTLAEVAVAALAGEVRPEPMLVHWARGAQLVSLVVERGRVAWSRVQRVVQGGGEAQLAQAVEAAEAVVPVGMRSSLTGRMFLGFVLDLPDRSNGAFLERIHPQERFARLFSGAGPDEVAARPELYGLVFVPPGLSLAGEDYRAQVGARRLGRRLVLATVLAGVAALVVAAGGWLSAGQLEARHEAESARLEQRAARARAVLPEVARIDELKRSLAVAGQSMSGLRADYFLSRFAEVLPADARLRQVAIRKAGQKEAAGSYEVAFRVEVSGAYRSTKAQAERMVAAFASMGELRGTQLLHDPDAAPGGLATLRGTLIVAAAGF
ncbi:hypothetical protein GCM10023089_08850 [Quisquiliibacterium transsilvanicum]